MGDDFISDSELAKLRQAEIDRPATEHENAGGWCRHCGCGNDYLGYAHLRSCRFYKPKQ